ncbi:helix-turn-helix domain-containing protein [Aliirhizobium smilacinae]|uniref:Helix-turn-helix domain-containing protein n=1 Tax=Aliirhizobium smilacinae TaxID=1395944 RepID=A0A5C4XPM2_9HYPH|nr:transcriptional regulator [Rhizobium smilacinae]TNM65297.1 helix-turn-helix domain-containing protein [Rhizobium smilacinae]
MDSKLQKHVEEKSLVEVFDPVSGKAVFRRPGYEGIIALNELEERIGDALRQAREGNELIHADVAKLLGLHPQVYGRYERGESRLTVTRLIQLSELLEFSPLDVILAAAPHKFGSSKETSAQRCELIRTIEALPDDIIKALLSVINAMARPNPSTSR